tara:strand:- start:1399 stop:3969 length:2571 start_codon:yes stop_codon:yes gene_type:complete
MAGSGRPLIVLICGLFILSATPYISADETTDYSQLKLNLDDEIKQWYLQDEVLEIDSFLSNYAEQISIPNDPSCNVFFSVKDSDSNLIFDNSNICRGQNQDLMINSNSVIEFDPFLWDFTSFEGMVIQSGWYNIEISHSKINLKDNIDIYFQNNIVFNNGIELDLSLVEVGGHETSNAHSLVGITLSNPTSDLIELPTESCKLIFELNGVQKLLNSCYGANSKLNSNEFSYLEGVFIESSSLQLGDNYVSVKTPGEDLNENLIITVSEDDDFVPNNLDSDLTSFITKNIEMEKEHVSFLSYSINIENTGDDERIVEFNDNCKYQMFVINDLGESIFDSSQDSCQEIFTSYSIDKDDSLSFEMPNWYLEDSNGCSINSGKYSVIIELIEYSITHHEEYIHQDNYRKKDCNDELMNTEYSMQIIDNTAYVSMLVSPVNNILKINNPCINSIHLESLNIVEDINLTKSSCEYTLGNYLIIDDFGESLIFEDSFEIPVIENLSISTVDYALTIEHSLEMGFSQYLEFQFEYVELEVIEPELFEFQGKWINIGTNEESCWMLSNDEQSVLLVDSNKLPSWKPESGWEGDYLISESDSVKDECLTKFDISGIEIHSIFSEQKIVVEEQVVVNENPVEEVSETIDVQEVTTVAIVVVSTSSIFALLGVFVMNTESLRIPSTAAGLWLLGLLGKTQETTDGKFQRGRLMGYLTANPGCHFRALMAALNMSNGQITHHLRLLENQELIWRLKDGRLVRYYPLNNSLHPGMDPDQLPIPLLSPDPNSLQGKILTLLDDEHQYGKFPTQAELSVSLEKSQQLISHHLRTLQKFGLVEKRKMGLKNRYKLTKEALFLLETDIDFRLKE